MNEIWLSIQKYQGVYEVSNHGRVRSIERQSGNRKISGQLLTHVFDIWGYPCVVLHNNGMKKTFFVHRLVLESFVGMRPIGFVCCHKDGNKLNNRLENIRWDTQKNNKLDGSLLNETACGERQGNAKLTNEMVRNARIMFDTDNHSIASLSRHFSISQSNMWHVINRKTWKHIS